MNARALNTPARSLVALLAIGALVLGVAACSGGSAGVSSILTQAFHPRKPINSGKLDVSLSFSATGLASLTSPVSLRLQGPFQSTGPGQLPHFNLGLTIVSSGRNIAIGATSTGSQFFIELQGIPFQAPDSAFQQLRHGYAETTGASGSAKNQPTFASLGIDPGSWLVNPTRAADQRVGGVDTVHVTAGLNVPRFLRDLTHLSGAGSVLGLRGIAGVPSNLAAAQQSALARSVRSAHVDVYAGKNDHVLRQLSLRANIAAPPDVSATLRGLRTGTLAFQLQFSDINQPQTILAPTNPQPLSKLMSLFGQLGVGSAGTGGAAGGAGTGATSRQRH